LSGVKLDGGYQEGSLPFGIAVQIVAYFTYARSHHAIQSMSPAHRLDDAFASSFAKHPTPLENIWDSLGSAHQDWLVVAAAVGDVWWSEWPDVPRTVTGFPSRVEQIRALGNAVVPAQVREAFMRLSGIKDASGNYRSEAIEAGLVPWAPVATGEAEVV